MINSNEIPGIHCAQEDQASEHHEIVERYAAMPAGFGDQGGNFHLQTEERVQKNWMDEDNKASNYNR